MTAPKKLTINDIAVAAGVSKATVSRYLNGHRDQMSAKTWERIKSVIDVSNYEPSDIASNLKKKKTNLIGISIADITSPFSVALIVGISKYLDRHGYTLLISDSGDSPEKEQTNIKSLLSKGVAGLLVNPTTYDNNFLIETACKGIPVVLCDRKVRNYNLDVVTSDHEAGMRMVIGHLKEKGYTRPILFSENWEQNSTRMRRKDSFIRFVEEIYGYCPKENEDIFRIDHNKGNNTLFQLKCMQKNLLYTDIPAIIGVNSITTARVYQAISELGLSIPNEIGLCGPEDWDWSNELNWPYMIRPHVTTLKVHSTEIGYQAAQRLLEKINEPNMLPKEISIPCKMQERESTALYLSK